MKVTDESRFTGESRYTVRNNQGGLVATVVSDGFFRRNSFYGYIQLRDESLVNPETPFGQSLLDAVQRYLSPEH